MFALLIPKDYIENVIDIDMLKLDGIERDPVKVRIASKFKHNPPTSLGVIVGKSGIAYRRKEDGVYVVPITALRA